MCLRTVLATWLFFGSSTSLFSTAAKEAVTLTLTPAAVGPQLVRVSLPFPRGWVGKGQTLNASDGHHSVPAALRPLTWHPVSGGEPPSVRRGFVTFSYTFSDLKPVGFTLRSDKAAAPPRSEFPARIAVDAESVTVTHKAGPSVRARLIAPARTNAGKSECEIVESNAFYLWQRYRMADSQWPRVIEVRADALGGVLIQAHLQRGGPGNLAPDFGWDFKIGEAGNICLFEEGTNRQAVTTEMRGHAFAQGAPCSLWLDNSKYRLYSPTAQFKRRGRFEAQREQDALLCRYLVCTAAEKVPLQQAAWRRAEFIISPAGLAPLTPALQPAHIATLDWRAWDKLYDSGPPSDLRRQPELAALLRYHHEAIIRSAARGDDWGNITSYSDGAETGGPFGMNRLNHCAPIFEEGYRSGDARLLQTAVLWCENFYDQSIWWGPGETGGTRYNNVVAMGQKPPDNGQTYMWRSTNSVSFCTKGYDAFFYAWEETGDPRMKQALEAQLAYAAKYLNAGENYTRNVGDVRDFMRLYHFTGEPGYLAEAKRLFGNLRTQLSTGDLFTESGHPISPTPPFIVDDQAGYKNPFAKPYIVGYALAGLPELIRLDPNEPKLREVVRAVSAFLAESQDPVGGWRYPHPRSPNVIMSQALEHAWQLVQAGRFSGPQERHLDAIERVLRQRLHGWRKTGKMFSGLTCWEVVTGKVKQTSELASLYQRPADRGFTRDYTDGRPDFGSAPPEGIVYFPEVLAFYLKHRPATRLLAAPGPDEPLGQVLAHAK